MLKELIQLGSQGDAAKEVQKLLNSVGYRLAEDGIYGPDTKATVEDFQEKNNLDVDGIVGNDTWAALTSATPVAALVSGAKNNTTKASAGTDGKWAAASTTPVAAPVGTGAEIDSVYQESDIVAEAKQALEAQMANRPGAYQSPWQSQLDEAINKILNREKFSYDFNGDALYQQYKDKYIQQGKMAMADTMGQAAAMTGGYGNSYAATVGNQAYQQSLQQLNDVIPELYQMAYDRYNKEGQDLYNQYAMISDRENADYGRYRDEVSDWEAERDYLTDRYDTEWNKDYTQHRDGVADSQWETSFNRDQAWRDEDMAYQKERDSVSDAQWQATLEYNKGRDAVADSRINHY